MFYNEEFLEATIKETRAAIEDLSLWSVHNNDSALDEIAGLKRALQEVETRMMINQMRDEGQELEDNGSEYDQAADYMDL